MTQHPTIYRIDTDHPKLRDKKNLDDVVKEIINSYYKKTKSNFGFDPKNMSKTEEVGHEYILYIAQTKVYESDWKAFLPEELTEHLTFGQKNLVLILFIQAEHDTYCIIGGKAYRIIIPFIDHNFGINTYSKIGDQSEDALISISSRGMTGYLSGAKELYRDDFKVRDYIKFGKIANKIHIKLSEAVSKTYFSAVSDTENERIQIEAGSGIKIKKGISFEQLSALISEFEIIKGLADQWDLSAYQIVSDRSIIFSQLNPVLEKKIFDDSPFIVTGRKATGPRFQFDFCNPNNFEKFYEADHYVLKLTTAKGGKRDLEIIAERDEIYETAIKWAVREAGNTNFHDFKQYLWLLHVAAVKNRKTTVSSGFMYHISAEIQIRNTSYFYLDTKWYKIQKSFIDELATDCKSLINANRAPEFILKNEWNKTVSHSEGDYNESYNGINNHIVIDKIITEGIELCDVLIMTSEKIYLCHVKYGFKASLRELYNQIMISAKRLREVQSSANKNFLKKIYKEVLKRGRSVNNLTEQEFISAFNKPATMVFAFASQFDSDLDVAENLDQYKSNIAKYSLVQCIRELRLFSGEVLIKQITKI